MIVLQNSTQDKLPDYGFNTNEQQDYASIVIEQAKKRPARHRRICEEQAKKLQQDEELMPKRSCKTELVNIKLNTKKVNEWGTGDYVKFMLKIKDHLPFVADYLDRVVEKSAVFSQNTGLKSTYMPVNVMCEAIIDLIERKKTVINIYVLITKEIEKLPLLDRLILDHFVYKKDVLNKILEKISRRTMYRRADQIIYKICTSLASCNITKEWLFNNFGEFIKTLGYKNW